MVAGQLTRRGDAFLFNYGRSYLAREEAIAVYEPELPQRPGVVPLLPGLSMPSVIRDASPDAWGRRAILNKRLGNARGHDTAEIDELTYLLASGSDRIGALDFQDSPSGSQEKLPAQGGPAHLPVLT